jgi:hypothetical protein
VLTNALGSQKRSALALGLHPSLTGVKLVIALKEKLQNLKLIPPFEVAHSCWSTPIDPRIGPDESQRRNFTRSRGIIDACKPFHWIKEFPPTSTITQQDFEETIRKWSPILSTNK